MRVVFFGTYDTDRHPRVRVLQEGLRQAGAHVTECNSVLGLDTTARVRIMRQPWRVSGFGARLGRAWVRLLRQARRVGDVDAVVVGYLGLLDIHLARRLWPHRPLVLDHMASAGDIARDRSASRPVTRLLDEIDRRALGLTDLVVVDTHERLTSLPPEIKRRTAVVPVGAPRSWFEVDARRDPDDPLRVVFFGLYTPLQGAPIIGEAIAALRDSPVEFTMIGHGQELAAAQARAGAADNVRWMPWVHASELPKIVAHHDVCLGIFGSTPKAAQVVPNKVFQGMAAGCAVVTSATPVQKRHLGEAAIYIPPGDAQALATTLDDLARDHGLLLRRQQRARAHAERQFWPLRTVEPLRAALTELAGAATGAETRTDDVA